jgi:diguanylate cyclase (GGDEF) domain
MLLGVEATAVGLTVWPLLREAPSATAVERLAILVALSVGYSETVARSERMQRFLTAGHDAPWASPLTVWSIAALLTLPAGWAAGFLVLQCAHLLMQARRERSGAPHRLVYMCAAAILAQLSAAQLIQMEPTSHLLQGSVVGGLTIFAAGLAFLTLDLAVMIGGIWLSARPPSVRLLLPDGDAIGMELASFGLGVGAAVLLVHSPVLLPAIVIPVVYMQRGSVLKMLHRASRTDAKTGLLHNVAWTDDARLALSRCERSRAPVSMLLLDVDNFKSINDSRGHLVGDEVLTAVAGALRHELRGHDGVGRFGGDEFVVLLEGLAPAEAQTVAERVRAVIEALDVSGVTPRVSIGIAHTDPGAPDVTVEQLLGAADTALYVAKAAGRNQLAVAPALVR